MKKKIFGICSLFILSLIFSFSLAVIVDDFFKLAAKGNISNFSFTTLLPKNLDDLFLMVSNPSVLHLGLILQGGITLFIIFQLWRPGKPKLAYHVTSGLGGPKASGGGEFGSARWRNKDELTNTLTYAKASQIKPPHRGGIVVGAVPEKNDIRVYLDTDDTHALLLGATRSGKSRSIILPSIWTIGKTGESMVLTDPKGELIERSKIYLESKGYEVIRLDFRTPLLGNHWNLLEPVIKAIAAGRQDMAIEAAQDIAHALVYQRQHNGDPIWELGEKSTIAGLIMALATETNDPHRQHMYSVAMMLANMGIYANDEECLLNEYIATLDPLHPARAAFGVALTAPGKTRSSFFAGAMAKLQLFADPSIADMTSYQDHTLADIGRRPMAVFLVIPDEKSTRNVLASLYINQVYMALVEEAIRSGGKLPNRVHFLLDEFGNMPSIPDMDKKITVAGGRGMKFLLAVQDIAQLEELYGKRSKTITGNCQTWIYLSTADPATAKTVSEKTGKYTISTQSVNFNYSVTSKSEGGGGGESLTGRALLQPDEIERWPRGSCLLLQARQNPAQLPLPDLSAWPADKELIKTEDYINPRSRREVPYWLPDFAYESEEPEEEEYQIPVQESPKGSILDTI